MVVALYLIPVYNIIPGVNGTAGDHAGRRGVRESRLVGLGGINHIDHGVAPEVHLPGSHYPDIIRSQVTAHTACHLKLNHYISC